MKTENDNSRTYFPRPDEPLSDEDAIEELTNNILLWVADRAEQNGDIENAKRLRTEASKE